MSHIPSNMEWFLFQVDNALKARDAVESALEGVAENAMRELSKRFPKRTMKLDSGMGSTTLTIEQRNTSLDYHTMWSYTHGFAYNKWPSFLEIPCKDLWEAIVVYQDNIGNGNDPGFGTIIYENGKRIKGLPAGGTVR